MPIARRARWLLAPIALLILLLPSAAASASTTPWGEITRFEGKGTNKKGLRFLFSEKTHLFGVDTKENGVFVGDELSEHVEGESYRLQKYTESGEWLAQAKFVPGVLEEERTEKTVSAVEGVAVDPELGRFYVLTVYRRNSTDVHDGSYNAAGNLYAFKTEPEGEKLVSATANKEGLLMSLEPGSETVGKALLEPRGLTVNPKTHEILIIGENDEEKKEKEELRLTIDRVGSDGKLISQYVDPKIAAEEEPVEPASSPVVSNSGKVYFERADKIFETDLKSEPSTVFELGLNLARTPFHEELLQFAEAESTAVEGTQLAIAPEGETSGKLFSSSETAAAEESGKVGPLINTALAVGYEDGGAIKTTELGWTGGISSSEPIKCAIEAGEQNTLIAAGKEGALFALTSRPGHGEKNEGEVVKFGPGGTGCPTAKAAGPIEALLGGSKVSELDTAHSFTLSVNVSGQNPNVSGASVLSSEWTIGGEKLSATTPPGIESQAAELVHKFTSAGEVPVEVTIHTDDLASPELKVTGSLHVKTSGFTIKNPTAQEVLEGETATFESSTSGVSKPTEQWEVSEDQGKTWKEVAAATSEKLLVGPTTAAENGFLYRAVFTNGGEKATSATAKLSVLVPAKPEVTRAPASVDVEEGHTANFEATASGERPPTVQWERSTDGGTSWSPLSGQTATHLEVPGTLLAQSGYQYRAVFTNQLGKATSAAATLTVHKKPPPPPPPPPPTTTTSSTPPPPPIQQVLGSTEAFPEAKVAGNALKVSSSGAVAIKVSCPAKATCTGTLTLKTLSAVAASAHASKKAKKAILTLAQAVFSVAGGSLKAITLHLSAKARTLLARSHTLHVKATIVAHNNAGASSTTASVVTLAPEKKRKHH
jgi:Immunoglobulin I-set domain